MNMEEAMLAFSQPGQAGIKKHLTQRNQAAGKNETKPDVDFLF